MTAMKAAHSKLARCSGSRSGSWYLTSKGERSSRSQFFALLDSCTREKFTKVVKADLERPAPERLRALASISQYSRRMPFV
jgi:hypothetical protein